MRSVSPQQPSGGGDGVVTDVRSVHDANQAFDVKEAFLVQPAPLNRLPSGPWDAWEGAWDATNGLRPGQGEAKSAQAAEWRAMIRERLPLIDVAPLATSLPALRRAHSLLAFLSHAYVHSGTPPKEGEEIIVPKSLAVPFCATADLLDVPPVISYGNAIIYNWRLKDATGGITHENVEMPTLFTRTASEEHFWRTSLVVESYGPEILSLIESALRDLDDTSESAETKLATSLDALTGLIEKVNAAIDSVRKGCEPRHFYWELRPWMTGGKWTWEGVSPKPGDAQASKAGWRVTDLGGATAGQSPLIPAFDIFLGVDHRARAAEAGHKASVTPALPSEGTSSNLTEAPAIAAEPPQATSGQLKNPEREQTFLERMAPYMPLKDRLYLSRLSAAVTPASPTPEESLLFPHLAASSHRLRSLVLASPAGSPLSTSYNACVRALEAMRKTHSRVALYYVLSQSRVEPPEGSAYLSEWQDKMEDDRQRSERRRRGEAVEENSKGQEIAGTGGTPLASFLKRARERTAEALVSEKAT